MAVMDAAFDPEYGEAWTRRQIGDALTLQNTHYLLAGRDGEHPLDGEEALGFVLTRGTAGEEEVLLIAVKPEARRNGIGRALLARLLESARQRGTSRLCLEMRDGNPAKHLYASLGFIPVSRRPNYYRGALNGPIDAITYTCEI
ncbi:GNAT family N-acetyltransferase [Altererythrobacter salegens]|uniref:GNAT family N-acetyltransferase n=2 Tax=Croceibacterium salegens TaxID=1737568 RepID=A0A6I4STL7_9SPHN|nr:GNAT family N-acetyltransferase [Croceibacterium salegens]